ncbi:MAG: MMPL family transporter [Sedimentisphaerales bacterium]|nr:MMPL family transporter [Sedimentisphaerales bacterium]
MTWNEDSYGRWVVQYRWWIILLTIPAVVAATLGIPRLSISNNTRVFFGVQNPDYQRLQAFENTYSREQSVFFIVAARDGDVFTAESLAAIAELTQRGWKLPCSRRVISLANFQHIRAEEDDLLVEDLVGDPHDLTEQDIERIRRFALAENTIVQRLVSPTGHVAGVYVALAMPEEERAEVLEVAEAARAAAEELRARYPDIDVYLTGSVMIDHAFGEASKKDFRTLVPPMFIAMSVLIGIALQSVLGTLAAVAVIVLSMIGGLGLAGWLGISLNAVSVGAPGLILTLAVADSVHILTTMSHLMREGRPRQEAVAESLRINLQPVFLTSITTIIGFLSMNFSESPPFRDLGNIVALGVAMAFLYSVLLLPALMAVLPVSARAKRLSRIHLNYDRLADFVVRRRKPVLWIMVALAAFATSGIFLIELNDNFLSYFDDTFAFRRATDFLIENLSGWDVMEYSLPAGQSGGITDPAYLTHVDEFAQWYRRQPRVVCVSAIPDTIKRLHRDMHGGQESYYRLPDRRDLIAQYLLLYEMSLPFGCDLNDQIDVDRSATRFTVTFESMSSREMRAMDTAARRWLQAHAPASMQAPATGLSLIWAHIARRNIISMLRGSFAALVLISGIMIVALRSGKLGLVSLVPNLLPPLMAFGIWGMIVGRVGLALSVVVAMTIGIVVDDTVHFLSKYRRARRQEGMSPEEAVHHAFHTVGSAMWITSVALTAGFLVLTLSHYRISSEMGRMCSLTVVLALVMDFLLLPTLLLKIDAMAGKLRDKSSGTAVDE